MGDAEVKAGRFFLSTLFELRQLPDNADDHVFVLICAEKVSLVLERSLSEAMQLSEGLNKELFSERHLGTLSSKLLLANCLGLLDDDAYRVGTTLRRIRNEFAHSTKPLTLASPEVKTLVDSLPLLTDLEALQAGFAGQPPEHGPLSARRWKVISAIGAVGIAASAAAVRASAKKTG